MGEDTARLREEIEATREDLSRDVDAVAFKASPQRIVNDRVEAAKSKVTGVKERVMGSAHETTSNMQGSLSGAAQSSSQKLHSAADTAREAPGQVAGQVTYRTKGNPLAAGLIAFGVGWLVSSLLPATSVETRAVEQGKDLATEHGVLDAVKQAGQEIGENLKPAAQDAVEQVKGTAAQGAAAVKEHGAQAAQAVKDEAAYQAQDAKAQHTSGSGASGQFSTTAADEELTPVYVETVDVTRTEVVPEAGRPTGAV